MPESCMFVGLESGADELRVNVKLDVVADQHAACFQRLVPHEAEVATIDLCVGAEAKPLAAPRIDALALISRVEGDRLRRTANRQLPGDGEALLRARDLRALEGDFREVLDIQE